MSMKTDYEVWIAGTGISLPCGVPIADAVSGGLITARHAADSGIRGVPIAPPGQSAADLSVLAATAALHESGLDPSEIGAHIHLSAHDLGKRPLWNEAVAILGGFDGRSLTTAMRDACDGLVFTQWAIPRLFWQDEPAVLVTTGDIWSEGIDRWGFLPGLAFSDGAAATVLTRERGKSRARIVASAHANEPRLAGMHRAGERFDLRAQRRIFEATEMPRDETVRLIGDAIARSVGQALADAAIPARGITHVTGPFLSPVLFDAENRPPLIRLGFVPGQFSRYLDLAPDICHTGPADPMIGLHKILPDCSPGDRLLAIGEGAGYSVTTMIVECV